MNIKQIILIISFLTASIGSYAQQNDITKIIDQYGKQKEAVLVQLSKDILSKGSDLTFYKSLIIEKVSDKQRSEIMDAIDQQLSKWDHISEIKKQGLIESGTYCIKSSEDKDNQFLLIKNTKKQLTIVYIEGNIPPNKLQNELKKLKDLFIYINDKRIKIG